MNTAITSGIKISVESRYQPQSLKSATPAQLFVYTIRIANHSDQKVQLTRRFWHIVEPGQADRFVDGQGVVGKEPILDPGHEFIYSSACDLLDGIGFMSGQYLMQNLETEEFFQVRIPRFSLEAVWKMN
jgi:ApaG protein